MSSTDASPICHTERTDDPIVMRWVCVSPQVGGNGGRVAPPGPLAAAALWVEAGALYVRAIDADWAVVDQAVRAALAAHAGWLCTDDAVGPPSLATLQRVVGAATQSLTGLHGGVIEVVGLVGNTVQVRMGGACHGCRFTDETLRRLAQPALDRVYPGLVLTVLQ
ncbi:MAG: NifU family protein [Actinomycetota bacterium]|nr:NifU family protein [Actinomycetota bacterium]